MQDNLISRKEVLELLEDRWYERMGTTNPFDWTVCETLKSIIDDVENLAVVLPASMRHGYWIEVRDKFNSLVGVKCSKCGRKVKNGGENYCPKCGATMYGGKLNND